MIYSRREFAKLSAMGLAAAGLTPQLGAQAGSQTGKRVGYAVIGLGTIADHFMRGTLESQYGKVTALVSGHRDKAERIAAQYGVPKESIYSYEDFDRIKDNKAVDAVYVALPNSMHAEYTIRAAKAGKHVICEKPMAISSHECEQMIAACKAANVKLMIAYRMQYDPIVLTAKRIVKEGLLGSVQTVIGTYGFNAAPNQWRLDKKLAGGSSLFDVGIYCMNTTRYILEDEPVGYTAVATTIDKDGRFDNSSMEENIGWTLRFSRGAQGSYNSTYGANTASFLQLQGSKGVLTFSPAFNYDGNRLAGWYGGGGSPRTRVDESHPEKDPVAFTRQIDHFAGCVWEGKTPISPGEEGLKDLQHVEQIYKAAGVRL